jgi:hydroxyacylglutathione hydrolase
MLSASSYFHFFRHTYPSANMVLVRGARPVLIDTGFGSDLADTKRLLHAAGTPPEQLALIVNTHYHSDHCGGNAGLQARYGTPVAAHYDDADLINRRDPAACAAEWLDQPVEPYRVERPLHAGDTIDTGDVLLEVLHMPGHTRGQISLYAPDFGLAICGDTVHADDVAWINRFCEGQDALDRAIASVERLARLPLRRALSGHGAPIDDPTAAFDSALRRYEKWQREPEKIAWHACKRIFTYQLMLAGGMQRDALAAYLPTCSWFDDYSRQVFGVAPAEFVEPLVAELLRSRAAAWHGERLVALAPHNPPPAGWPAGPARPRDWPPIRETMEQADE